MVLKKKSLSVSSVLTIVLAVLLVLSIAMGFTGAWFTDKAEFDSINLGGISLGQIKVTAEASNAELYGSHKVGNDYVINDTAETTRKVVLPGDYIKATITVTNSSSADAYILVYDVNAKLWYNLDGDPVTVDGSLESAKYAPTVTEKTFDVEGSVATTEENQDKELEDYIQFNYEVVACQAVNIDQADAWEELKGLVTGA